MKLIDAGNEHKLEIRELRIFAFALCIFVFLIFSVKMPWLTGYKPSLIYLIIINVFILLLAFIKPLILLPVFKFWRSFAKIIGGVLAFLALAFIFYFVLTPTALLARLFKYNPLCLHMHRKEKKVSFYNLECQNRVQNDFQNLF